MDNRSQNPPLRGLSAPSQIGFGKGGLLEKGLFRKVHFLESLENKGESEHFLEILENLEILEILEIPPVKRPLSQ